MGWVLALTARNLAYLPLALVGKHLNGRVCILPWALPVRTSRMKVLTGQGVRGTRPEVGPATFKVPRTVGGESPGAILGAGGTVLTRAGLCLLQLQKLLQEATVVGKLVGNVRVVCVCNSRPEAEEREDKP